MDPLLQGNTIEQMERIEDFRKRSSENWTAVSETTAFRKWTHPTRREEEYRGAPRQLEDIGGRSCKVEVTNVPALVNPFPKLQQSSECTSDSNLPHRTVEHPKQQEPKFPKVWQGAVKPGSNQRTRERQERRNWSARNLGLEAFIRSGNSREALARREGHRRARGPSARQKMVIHSQTDNWLRTTDWRVKRRAKSRQIAHGSEAKRGLSSRQDDQAAGGLLHPTQHHPAGAAFLRVIENSSRPKATNARPAHLKSQDIIIKTFGQTFVDNIKAICSETEARGGAGSPRYACEFDTSTLKNVAKKRILIASVTMPETPQIWTPSRWQTLTQETYLLSR